MAAAERNLKVVLIDTDPNEPMKRFQTAGEDTGAWSENVTTTSVFQDDNIDLGQILENLEEEGTDLVLLDTKGGEGKFIEYIVQMVDYIIVPVGLSADEVDGTELTFDWLDALREEKIFRAPTEALLSRRPSPSHLSAANKNVLADIEEIFPLVPIVVPLSKLIENHSLYGLFHKVIEDIGKGDALGKGQARPFRAALDIYGKLLDHCIEKAKAKHG